MQNNENGLTNPNESDNVNMTLWNKVKETDPKHTKLVSYGSRKFTTISAQYQIQKATEQFGSYGSGFGIKSINYHVIDLHESQKMLIANAVFFAKLSDNKESEFPISSSIMLVEKDKNMILQIDDEAYKKIETDITTKALSKLGFNADVFLGMYDDNRYVNALKEKYSENTPTPPQTAAPPPPKATPKQKPELLPGTIDWTNSVKFLATDGGTIERLQARYSISPENVNNLNAEAKTFA